MASLLATVAAACANTGGRPEPTEVPGAAATLTRSLRTPIPTPVRAGSPAPSTAGSPVPSSAPSAVAVASPLPRAEFGVTEADVSQARQRLEQALASPSLPGIEDLLLDRVSLSSAEGGQVFDRAAAAAWLRDRAQPGLRIASINRNALAVVLEAETEGWASKPPGPAGRLSFNFHRFDASGKQDEVRGDWKIDIIAAE